MIFRSASIALGLACLSVPQAAYAELPPASVGEIIEATQTCMTAVSASGVDTAKLSNDGWRAATASEDGKPMKLPMPIYGKGSVVMMLTPDASPACFVTARVAKIDDAQVVHDKLAAVIGTEPVAKVDGGPLWLVPGGNAVQFATTGSREKPSIRIAVVRSAGDKK